MRCYLIKYGYDASDLWLRILEIKESCYILVLAAKVLRFGTNKKAPNTRPLEAIAANTAAVLFSGKRRTCPARVVSCQDSMFYYSSHY